MLVLFCSVFTFHIGVHLPFRKNIFITIKNNIMASIFNSSGSCMIAVSNFLKILNKISTILFKEFSGGERISKLTNAVYRKL